MQTSPSGVPLTVAAAITAALAVVLDKPVGSFAVKRIEPAQSVVMPSFWAKAGQLESQLARQQFGNRTR